MSHLIRGVQCRIIEQGGSCSVHKAVDIIIQVGQHMIRSEGRRDDAIYNDILLLRDYGVQSLALHGLYSRDHVFA